MLELHQEVFGERVHVAPSAACCPKCFLCAADSWRAHQGGRESVRRRQAGVRQRPRKARSRRRGSVDRACGARLESGVAAGRHSAGALDLTPTLTIPTMHADVHHGVAMAYLVAQARFLIQKRV